MGPRNLTYFRLTFMIHMDTHMTGIKSMFNISFELAGRYLSLVFPSFFCIEESFCRDAENQAFGEAGYDKLEPGQRLLLWHGSRSTNFAGILKQGLRIAPPEAPVTGYMFGKGIYLADVSYKQFLISCSSLHCFQDDVKVC